jgi:carbonic anhydrase/acetyltransferase-like protein (isoleucine patch superfamily)
VRVQWTSCGRAQIHQLDHFLTSHSTRQRLVPLKNPTIDSAAYVHPLAVIIGDVQLGPRVSVWPTAVIRGDTDTIKIGENSNVQDGTVIHVDAGVPTTIGKRVAIGHRAIVHGSTIEDDCLIAMGAILLNGVHVGTGSIVGAGAVCTEGMQIPPNSLVIGIPARRIRETSDAERERIRKTVDAYVALQQEYRERE